MKGYVLYKCLHCVHQEKLEVKNADYSEVIFCPKCKGTFVDVYKINKYIRQNEETKCKGKPLTEEQIDMLQFMTNNYYKKNMDICSCDVERVLGKKEIELTKLEKAVIISKFIDAIGMEELAGCVGLEKLDLLAKELEVLHGNTTPNAEVAANKSSINNLIDSFLEDC